MGDHSQAPTGRVVLAAFVYVLLVFIAGFALGAVRVLAIAPAVGALKATLIEAPVMLLISWAASRRVCGAFAVAERIAPRLAMGAIAFAILMLLEFALGLLAFSRGGAEQIAAFQEPHALIGLVAQSLFGLTPALQAVIARLGRG
jgi:hypothetical protein